MHRQRPYGEDTKVRNEAGERVDMSLDGDLWFSRLFDELDDVRRAHVRT